MSEELEIVYQVSLGLDGGPDTTATSSCYHNVGEILRTDELARADDDWLVVLYWCDIDGLHHRLVEFMNSSDVSAATSEKQAELVQAFLKQQMTEHRLEISATIRRRRREYTKAGRYLPDEETQKRRKRLSRAGPQGHKPKRL